MLVSESKHYLSRKQIVDNYYPLRGKNHRPESISSHIYVNEVGYTDHDLSPVRPKRRLGEYLYISRLQLLSLHFSVCLTNCHASCHSQLSGLAVVLGKYTFTFQKAPTILVCTVPLGGITCDPTEMVLRQAIYIFIPL